MKKKLGLLSWAVCSTSLCIASQCALADDPPENKKKVVIVKSGDGDTKTVREEVSKELDKANISAEMKADILAKIEDALSKVEAAKVGGGKAKGKSTAEAKKTVDGNTEEVSVTVISGDDSSKAPHVLKALPHLNKTFKAQVLQPSNKDGESFRIGIACQEIMSDEQSEDTTKLGLRIESVMEGSPAEKAGIKEGDVLVAINDQIVSKVADLMSVVQDAGKSDKSVSIRLERDEKAVTVEVKPAKMKSADIEMNNIELTLPSGGFVLDPHGMKNIHEHIMKFVPNGGQNSAFAFGMAGNSDELKKELEELKSEVSEMKKMIQQLIDKK